MNLDRLSVFCLQVGSLVSFPISVSFAVLPHLPGLQTPGGPGLRPLSSSPCSLLITLGPTALNATCWLTSEFSPPILNSRFADPVHPT